ncbi:MAG: GAF domain-containing protein [Candidatus Limnocylindrales bacterium]
MPTEVPATLPRPTRTGTVSVTKAARILGVHPNTVRTWTDQGRLRCLRINPRGDRRYQLEDLDAFLEAAARGPRPTDGPNGHDGHEGWPAGRPAAALAALQLRPAGQASDVDQAGDVGRRDTELRVLASISLLAARGTDLDAMLGAIARLLRDAFAYRMVAFSELRDDMFWLRVAAGLDVTRYPPIMRDQGLAGASLLEGRPIFSPDVRSDPRYVVSLPEVSCEIAVPIFIGDDPWGVLLVGDERPNALTAQDAELLEAVANQVAVVAQNVRLVGRIQRQLEQAEALRRISADISSKLDLRVILADLIDHATLLFRADRAAVYLRQPDGSFEAAVSRGLSERYLEFVRRFPTPSVAASVLEHGHALATNDYANDATAAGAGGRPAVVQEGFDTVAMAPLMAGDEVLGVLGLYHDRRRTWEQHDLDALDALAAQASIAITNARNYAQTATWAAQLQSIQQLGSRLARLTTVRDIGQAICGELNQLIDYHNVRVYTVSGEDLEPIAWHGEIGEYRDEVADQLRLKVGQGITGWVALNGVAQSLPDANADPRTQTIPGTDEDLPESLLVAPMKYEDRVLGVLVLSKLGLHQFSQDDLRLLEIYGSLAAQAVSNALATEQLRAQSAALERRVRSQQELLGMTEAILSTLDPTTVLQLVAERVGTLVEVDTIAIDLHDPQAGVLRSLIARGVDAEGYQNRNLRDDEGVAGWVVRHGEAQLVPDELADPRVAHFASGPEPGSVIVVPLRGRDRIVGVLTAERLGSGRAFTEDEFELIQLFAAQASIALQNAQAHRAVEMRAQTDGLTALSNHATFQEALELAAGRGERFSLLMIDLDDFKAYNDSHGHQAGDGLLLHIADALVAACRESDRVFRYGGDEFTILLPGTETRGALAVADKVRAAVKTASTDGQGSEGSALTCSVGVASFPDDGPEAGALLFAADRACYLSKRSGRDLVSTAAEGARLATSFLPTAPTPVDTSSLDATQLPAV